MQVSGVKGQFCPTNMEEQITRWTKKQRHWFSEDIVKTQTKWMGSNSDEEGLYQKATTLSIILQSI